jgi:hypothetical protein
MPPACITGEKVVDGGPDYNSISQETTRVLNDLREEPRRIPTLETTTVDVYQQSTSYLQRLLTWLNVVYGVDNDQ